MAKAGDTIENPVTGERILFKKTARDTNGEYLEMEFFVRPGGAVAVEHIHPDQDEDFEVLSGTIVMSVQGRKSVGKQGFKHTVKAGVPHVWANGGDDELHCRVTLSPALQMEQFFEVLFGLVRDGKSNKKGVPSLIHMAPIVLDHKCWLAKPPVPLQRVLFHILNPIAVLLGYPEQHKNYIT